MPYHLRREGSAAPCVALIDQRYMSWLLGLTPESDPIHGFALSHVLSGVLEQVGVSAEVQRVYWYSDVRDDALPQGLIHRNVAARDSDGGASARATLAADLKTLAERKAFRHLILASDDQRLITLIDEAQLHGVLVHILADEASRHLKQLRKDDPEWADLLSQADSRLLLNEHAVRDLTQPHFAKWPVRQAQPEDIDAIRPILTDVVQAWWADEPEDLREDLREELQVSRGIPQEVDRHMLLRVRKALDRTLSFHEKKLLRDMVRGTVLSETPAPELQSAD
ncbi:MAG: hypothetical protein QM527_10105 [Alphaproteobacteria bacterium]|nr:hypothetical protein [Alphaproteobacteria bacterium]